MARDGYSRSIWQIDNHFPNWRAALPATTDVLVVGGGITGITTALNLQRAGANCTLIEAHNLGFGTTGGTTAHLNTLLDATYAEVSSSFGADQAALLAKGAAHAIAMIRDNAALYAPDCRFAGKDGYLLALDKEQESRMRKIVRGAVDAGLSMKVVEEVPSPLPFHAAACIKDQAQFHPLRYIHGLARAFTEAGGVIVEECMAKDVEGDGPFTVHTTLGRIAVRNVAYATHIPPGITPMNMRCAPYRSYAIAVTLKDKAYPDAVIYDLDKPYHYYRSQETLRGPVLIAGGYDHKTGHGPDTREHAEKLEQHVRDHFKVDAVVAEWSAQYYESVDGLPYIGQLPGGKKGILMATGFGGNGMIYGTKAGHLLADQVLGRADPLAELFDPARNSVIKGFRKFTSEAADVAGKWIGGRMGVDELKDLDDLHPGQARVVKYKGRTMALSRTRDGEYTALDPICTHMGCTVSWNAMEHSWDCPCHGGRFDRHGAVLTGPPQKPLKPLGPNFGEGT